MISAFINPAGLLAPVAVATGAGAATLVGGSLALRYRSVIGLSMGFSVGAVLGVALFDLFPEALRLGQSGNPAAAVATAVAAALAGVLIYLAIDRLALNAAVHTRAQPGGRRGHFGAASLTLHSLMDGLGIGLAFQVSNAIGLTVAVAVLAHDLVDGINTVNFSLAGGTGKPAARRWLAADAIAPLVGMAVSHWIRLPRAGLGLLLALFSGFFLYIGARELLGRKASGRMPPMTLAASAAGLAAIWLVVRLSG